MEVLTKIRQAIDILDEIEIYDSGISQKLSEVDEKQQDLLHYIENNKINMLWCYKMVKELKTIREERRKIKNDMELLTRFREQKTKLAYNIDNRKMLLAEMYKKEKSLQTKYKNRQYTEEELKAILR